MKTRYFYDTEFNHGPGYLDLISLGMVCQDGREFYAVSSEFDPARCNDFVQTHVLPNLGDQPRETKAQIRDRLRAFVGNTRPEFWAYFGAYDHVLLCDLFGAMVDLPKGWPMLTMDLKQAMIERGLRESDMPRKPKVAHNALVDAQWNRAAHETIRKFGTAVRIDHMEVSGAGSVGIRLG